MLKKTSAFLISIVVSIVILFVDWIANIILHMQNSSWETMIYAVINSVSCVVLIAVCRSLDRKFEVTPYVTTAGLFVVLVAYLLSTSSLIPGIGVPVYLYFPTVMATAVLVRLYLTSRARKKSMEGRV